MVEGQHKDGTVFPIRLSIKEALPGDDPIFIGIIERLPDQDGKIRIDKDGKILSFNENIVNLFGYTVSELKGANVKILMTPQHKNNHDSYLSNYHNGGTPKVIGKVRNVPARHKDGTCFPICLQIKEIRKENQPVEFEGTISKVDTMEAVFTLDENGTIVSCNQNFIKPVCGYSSGELIGNPITQIVPEIPTSSEVEKISTEPPKKKIRRSDSSFRSMDWSEPHTKYLKHKDGSLFPVIIEIQKLEESPTDHRLYAGRIKRRNSINSHEWTGKTLEKYELGETLGNGTYGKVKLAVHTSTRKLYAIKILRRQHLDDRSFVRIQREIEILKVLNHPHIAKFHEVIELPKTYSLVMEYAGSQTLEAYIKKNGILSEQETHKLFRQILSAVQHCHDRNIIHRDIKHTNIVLDANGNAKLIDFGLSNYNAEFQRKTQCGTPLFAAPEILLGGDYHGLGVDIWSLGIVLYSMLTGELPFSNLNEGMTGKFPDPPGVSKGCCKLMHKMLKTDQKKRLTANQIAKDPWVVSGPTDLPGQIPITCTVLSSNYDSEEEEEEEEEEDNEISI